MFALQSVVFMIFLLLGITGLGNKLVAVIPNSLKSGIIIGAGIAAMMGELKAGGRIDSTPVSLLLGSIVLAYILLLAVLQAQRSRPTSWPAISKLGMIPGLFVAIAASAAGRWGGCSLRTCGQGITRPDFKGMTEYLIFAVGMPSLDMFLLAIPTAIIAYVIALGDVLVGFSVQAHEHRLARTAGATWTSPA